MLITLMPVHPFERLKFTIMLKFTTNFRFAHTLEMRKYYLINGFSIIYIRTKNHQLPPEFRNTDNVTSKWPRAGGATMSRAQNGHIIISNTQYIELYLLKKVISVTDNLTNNWPYVRSASMIRAQKGHI